MLNRPSSGVKKSVVMRVGALLAMMVILVLSSSAPNGVFAHPHDDGQTHDGLAADTNVHIHIHYAENGTGEVRDFDSTDPEGDAIEWNVRGVDAADFEISSTGVLTFMESPDFENPTDRGLNLNPAEDDNFDGVGEFAPIDNNYQITVSATEMSAALPAKRTDLHLTVIVGNEDDPGELTLQWLQPEVDTPIMATLTDSDGGITGTDWTWYRSNTGVGIVPDVTDPTNWIEVTPVTAQANEPTSSYNPQGDTVADATDVAIDEDDYLRVMVSYTDSHGSNKTMNGISTNPVRAAVSSGANASPDFQDDTDDRSVPESTAVGANVGDPVTATDTNNDTLTYELVKVAAPNDGDDEFFDIDMATGQITVAQNLDYDSDQSRGTSGNRPDDGEYMVTVRATDPSGSFGNITVTITAVNVNEDPVVTGRAELSVAEGTIDITDEDAVLVYTILPDAPAITEEPDPTNQQNEYVYEDPDHRDSIARWNLEGDDAGAFDHSGRFEPRYLQFKVPPDYENPTDMNRDNVYEVTLVATDTNPLGTGAGIGKVNVWLTVTNVDEAGKVVFTEGKTAYLDQMLVAEVQDPDDHGGFDDMGEPYGKPHQGVHIVSWQWSRALTDVTDTVFVDIPGATTNRYTAESSDRGYYLRATATYTDPHSDEDDPGTDGDDRINLIGTPPSLRTVMATTENAVNVESGLESAPTFSEAMNGRVTRYVAENAMPDDNVGDPVEASGENLAYTLDGPDKDDFTIEAATGQITVGADTSFNYEDPDISNTYQVTVKVEVTNGDANQKAEIVVDIMVTDVDELPMITDADDKVVVPPVAVSYPEIDEAGAPNTAAVATYVGTDPEEDSISWDLRGADASFFTINGGVLQFVDSPDFEDPKDRLGTNTATPGARGILPDGTGTPDNIYSVVIRAIASRTSGDTGPAETVDTLVNVTVTDVNEDGDVVISLLQPEVGIGIMASLTDPDGQVTSVISWKWEVSEVAANVLDIDTDEHWGDAPGDGDEADVYTPDGVNLDDTDDTNDDVIDEGKYLRVTASYSEDGVDRTAHAMSAYPVQARGLGEKNESPDFDGDKVELSVAETAEVGDDVAGPVVATVDTRSKTDILTYRLEAVEQSDLDGITGVTLPSGEGTGPDDDLAAFDINKATGQITVAQKLDFESRGTPDDGKYVVVATVTDPSGLNDSIVVVITAEDINEDPVLSGRPELTINEIDSAAADAANPLFVGNTADQDPEVNVYNVVDEDRRAATNEWSLEGVDAGEFQLIGSVGRTLVFRNQPDYENPADFDGDNVYKVTVVTLDGHGGRGEFDVCIAVMNINEEGKITLRDEDGNELVQPRARGPITAELTDPDGGVTGITWQWARSEDDPPTPDDPTDIAGATTATYTPTNADDIGFFLKVTATYMDAKNDAPTDTTPDTDDRMAEVTATYAVLEKVDLKRSPEFPEFPEETATRMVAENAPSTTFVGDHLPLPVDLDDPERVGLTYTLEGDDTEFFELLVTNPDPDSDPNTDDAVRSTQIRVKLHDMGHDLDHEDEDRNGVYEVVLKVTDDSGLEDTITVTIMVTDRNEAPSTPMEGTGEAPAPANNAPEFQSTETGMRSVPENTATGMPIGDPVMATDADAGDTLTYTLGGTDMASFAIDAATGQLMTKAALDYEMPADADTDNAYEVTVTASDGNAADDATIAVTITVTAMGLADSYDANEDGMIDGTEVLNAVEDYFNDVSGIDSDRILDIVELYFSS